MKITKKVKVKNNLGLHTRPATALVKLLQNNPCDVRLTHKKETVNAKSILGILMLAAQKNSTITIVVEGETAQETMEMIIAGFESHFGEDS